MKGLPTVVEQRTQDDQIELDILVDADCLWFDGHFPEHPILPGVVHIGWAAHFAAEHWGWDGPPYVLERIKFKRPVRPEASLTLRLHAVDRKVKYDYRHDGVSVSSGTLNFPGTP